ncbi:MAG: hypothetical protein MUF24_14645, partial [Chitinophagaceae bacterium]|nr:hypothetical protein [Chitinophagaceae bacterium]
AMALQIFSYEQTRLQQQGFQYKKYALIGMRNIVYTIVPNIVPGEAVRIGLLTTSRTKLVITF